MPVDPQSVTKYDRTNDELLEFWLFALFVRGKNADVQAKKLDEFVKQMHGLPKMGECIGMVEFKLRQVKAGQYGTLTKAITQTLIKLERDPNWLRSASALELEQIDGVGPKTARFFILHSRKNARVAVLDTHIMRFLQERHPDLNLKRTTPSSSSKYAMLEGMFLGYADAFDLDPAALDLAMWRASRESSPWAWPTYYEGDRNVE